MAENYKEIMRQLGFSGWHDLRQYQMDGVRNGRTVLHVSVEVYSVDGNLPDNCIAEDELILQLPSGLQEKHLIMEKPVTGTILSVVSKHTNKVSTASSKIRSLMNIKKEYDRAQQNGLPFMADDGGYDTTESDHVNGEVVA